MLHTPWPKCPRSLTLSRTWTSKSCAAQAELNTSTHRGVSHFKCSRSSTLSGISKSTAGQPSCPHRPTHCGAKLFIRGLNWSFLTCSDADTNINHCQDGAQSCTQNQMPLNSNIALLDKLIHGNILCLYEPFLSITLYCYVLIDMHNHDVFYTYAASY